MRARTHSFAFLPATSTLATLVLTVAWWTTMIGLTGPQAPHLGLVVISAVLGIAVVSVGTHPQVRAALARWVRGQVRWGPRGPAPGVAHRWRRAARSMPGPRAHDVAVLRVALPRAPGGDPITA